MFAARQSRAETGKAVRVKTMENWAKKRLKILPLAPR